MPTLKHDYTKVRADEEMYGKGYVFNTLPRKAFDAFSPDALGLGDISQDGHYVQVLSAMFDLEGFTSFCNQPESHLVVPEFLGRYLQWMFNTIKQKFREGDEGDKVRIWGSIPFFVKFLGDGLLMLWDTEYSAGYTGVRNIITRLVEISDEYVTEFVPDVARHCSNVPKLLRCGVARGQVVSIGDFGDYVGSCINVSARLQKLGGTRFAVSRRGLDLSEASGYPAADVFVLKQVALRGIGNTELVYLLRDDFEALSSDDKAAFRNI